MLSSRMSLAQNSPPARLHKDSSSRRLAEPIPRTHSHFLVQIRVLAAEQPVYSQNNAGVCKRVRNSLKTKTIKMCVFKFMRTLCLQAPYYEQTNKNIPGVYVPPATYSSQAQLEVFPPTLGKLTTLSPYGVRSSVLCSGSNQRPVRCAARGSIRCRVARAAATHVAAQRTRHRGPAEVIALAGQRAAAAT
jgi:hypothetical protein